MPRGSSQLSGGLPIRAGLGQFGVTAKNGIPVPADRLDAELLGQDRLSARQMLDYRETQSGAAEIS